MTLALEALYTAAKAELHDVAPDVETVFGRRKPTRQTDAWARVIWYPGDEDGNAGAVLPPVQPGRTPARPLATLGEIFTVLCHATDRSDLSDEFLQYIAARSLFDAWYRAMYNAAFSIDTGGRVLITALTWSVEKKERPLGATLRALCTIQAAILDYPVVIVNPAPTAVVAGSQTSADGETTSLTETQTITKEDTGP